MAYDSILSDVIDAIISLMTGSTGTGRVMPTAKFRHFDSPPDRVGAIAANGAVHPFALSLQGIGSVPDVPSNVSGDYVYASHVIRMTVLYATKPQHAVDLERDMADDTFRIRRVLGWPPNWCITTGWVGCDFLADATEEIGTDDKPEVVAHHFDLQVQLRELHT